MFQEAGLPKEDDPDPSSESLSKALVLEDASAAVASTPLPRVDTKHIAEADALDSATGTVVAMVIGVVASLGAIMLIMRSRR